MSSESIYSDTVPYTYYIKWSALGKSYYGRRTAKGCHPSEFWISYKTSSNFVKDFIKTHGDPDIIEIRKIFSSTKECVRWEERVLNRINVAKRDEWLNKSNGKNSFDTSGHVVVKEKKTGRIIGLVPKEDLRILSGEYVHHSKNNATVKDASGNTFMVSLDDSRVISGELVGITRGKVVARDAKTMNTIGLVDKNDARFSSGEIVQLNTKFSTKYNLLTGEKKRFNLSEIKNLPKWWFGLVTDKVQALDLNGIKNTVSIYDDRWKSGELRRCDSNGKAFW